MRDNYEDDISRINSYSADLRKRQDWAAKKNKDNKQSASNEYGKGFNDENVEEFLKEGKKVGLDFEAIAREVRRKNEEADRLAKEKELDTGNK